MFSSGALVDEAAANKAAIEVVGIDVADDTDTPINEAAAAPISEPVVTIAEINAVVTLTEGSFVDCNHSGSGSAKSSTTGPTNDFCASRTLKSTIDLTCSYI